MLKIKASMILAIVGFMLSPSTAYAASEPSNVDLRDKRITISMKHKQLYDVFERLINDYDIAIGFEQSNLDGANDYYSLETNIPYDEPKPLMPNGQVAFFIGNRPDVEDHFLTLEYQNARLEDVMNDIVGQMKNYAWRTDDEIINIYPLKGREPIFAQLMDRRIGKFFVAKGATVMDLQPAITFELPEFKAFVAENGLYSVNWQNASWSLSRPIQMEMSFKDLTFRELLNGITRLKRGGWILKRGDPKVYKPGSEEINKDCIHLIL